MDVELKEARHPPHAVTARQRSVDPSHSLLDRPRLVGSLMERLDVVRLGLGRSRDPERQSHLGQFLTPGPLAQLMASMFRAPNDSIRLLDPGAGIGSLTAAFVAEMCGRPESPKEIHATVFEIDELLLEALRETLESCAQACTAAGIRFSYEIETSNFITAGADMIAETLFQQPAAPFDCAILNPPYRKIRSDSEERLALRNVGIESPNLYSGFLALAADLLRPDGELVAVTPRSFCNGPYFKSFRRRWLERVSFRRIHVFQDRESAFSDDRVLQENIVFHAVRGGEPEAVRITAGEGPEDPAMTTLHVEPDELVHPHDSDAFIHLVCDDVERRIATLMSKMESTLDQLGLEVSTGRVVAFRAEAFLRRNRPKGTVPLIHPKHFVDGRISWSSHPVNGSNGKPDAIVWSEETADLLLDSRTYYVLVKRFSAKEESRRIVPAVYDPELIDAERVGFENHLNYFHRQGRGIDPVLARGLAAYLGSTFVDRYFRQFSGHTQVNASDLKSLRYPSEERLRDLGRRIEGPLPDQRALDQLLRRVLGDTVEDPQAFVSVEAAQKVEEAGEILRSLGLPRKQQNERSSLTLLALLGVRPEDSWRDASDPLRGVAELMGFMADHYGKVYASGSRETVRKDTVHHFVEAGLILKNPDDPKRPTNSPKTVYQIAPILLRLIQTFREPSWAETLARYLESAPSLRSQYARHRRMERVPLRLPSGQVIKLSPGGQSRLVKKILDDFCAFFTPGGEVVYIGDTAEKWAYFDEALLAELGVSISEHGKIPDVVVYLREKGWLVLVEAVESRGPMDAKRMRELRELFLGSKAGLVFVTAFKDRKTMAKHLGDLAWESEVWVADSPSHLIHFDGERFLGPYEEETE